MERTIVEVQERQAGVVEGVSEIWSEILGAVYDRDDLERGFDYTIEQIETMVKEGAVVELTTSYGATFYPASCLDDNGDCCLDSPK